MRSHIDSTVENPYASHLNPCNCPECGKRCLTAHHLKGHLQRKHLAKNKKPSEKLMEKYGYLFGESAVLSGLPLQSQKEINDMTTKVRLFAGFLINSVVIISMLGESLIPLQSSNTTAACCPFG